MPMNGRGNRGGQSHANRYCRVSRISWCNSVTVPSEKSTTSLDSDSSGLTSVDQSSENQLSLTQVSYIVVPDCSRHVIFMDVDIQASDSSLSFTSGNEMHRAPDQPSPLQVRQATSLVAYPVYLSNQTFPWQTPSEYSNGVPTDQTGRTDHLKTLE